VAQETVIEPKLDNTTQVFATGASSGLFLSTLETSGKFIVEVRSVVVKEGRLEVAIAEAGENHQQGPNMGSP
jgi:hypothetical protein